MTSIALLAIFILPTFVFDSVLGDGITLEADKASYTVGETVFFSGLGYSSSGTSYVIDVSHSGSVLVSVGFNSDESDGIPTDASWAIPFDAENGTYVADSYNVTNPLYVVLLASTAFEVLNITEALGVIEGNLTNLMGNVTLKVTVNGIDDSLLASLNNAMRKIEGTEALFLDGDNKTAANQLRAARNVLTAFVHKVLAQASKAIDNATVRALVGNASAYIEYVDSMIVTAELPLGKRLALNIERALAKQERHMDAFIVRRGLAEATTAEDYVAEVELTEESLGKALGLLKTKWKETEGLWTDGAMSYDEFMMLLRKYNGEAEGAKELAELLSGELEASSQNKPALGRHLGPLIKIAKELIKESSDVINGFGQQMSKDSQVNGGEQQGNAGGKGNGHNNGKKG